MNIVADEGVDRVIVEHLRHDGHAVTYIAEQLSGITDDEVLQIANTQHALLLTIDKDFGELVFRLNRIDQGVVLVRLEGLRAETKAAIVARAFRAHGQELLTAFSVIGPGMVRIRKKTPLTRTITLTLPDRLYGPIQRMAQATDQPVEAVLLTALQASLPSLDGLPDDLAQELAALEALDTDTLRQVLLEVVPVEQQHDLEDLLDRNQAEALSTADRERLASLQRSADRMMLRKARAAVLLRFRGQRLPTLAELRQQTIDPQ